MSDVAEQYTDEMKDQFHFYAAWFPGEPLKLGDVGTLDGNLFTRIDNITKMGFHSFETRKDLTKSNLNFSSKGSVKTTIKLSGSVAPLGSALTTADLGFIIEFGDEYLTAFQAIGAQWYSIESQTVVSAEILKRYKEKNDKTNKRYWDKNWVVISHLMSADGTTSVTSNQENAKIEVKANANIGEKNVKIADPKFEFSSIVTSGVQFSDDNAPPPAGQKACTPLFKLIGIKTNILGGNPSVENRFASGFDLLTPENANKEYKDNVFVGYISDNVRE
ncbi:MAG: hypothetical protein ABI840_05700 [bacterium]